MVAQRGQTVAGVVADTGKDKDGKHFIRLHLTTITAADGTQFPIQSQLTSIQGHTTPGGAEAGTISFHLTAVVVAQRLAAWQGLGNGRSHRSGSWRDRRYRRRGRHA